MTAVLRVTKRSKFKLFSLKLTMLSLIFLCCTFFILTITNTSNTRIQNYGKCPLCNFTSLTNVSSTRRDAIFTATTVYKSGIDILVRSLRTTGCQARIIIFVTSNFEPPISIQDCDIEYINVGPLTTRILKSPYKSRWEWYERFLSKHVEEFDRIFHTDSFDATFFGDPFTYMSDVNKIYVQEEGVHIKGCPYNSKWLRDCHSHHDLKTIKTLPALCSGSLGGGAQSFLGFTRRLISHPEWPMCWGRGYDQGDFNFIMRTQWDSMKIQIMDCDSTFNTMQYCTRKDRLADGSYLLSRNGTRLVYAHQYNRFKEAEKVVKSVCPIALTK